MASAVLQQPADRLQETQFAVVEPAEEASASDALNASKSRQPDYGSISGGGAGGGDGPPSMPPLDVAPASQPSPAASARVLAPDLLRGLLMVLQSIDHATMTLGPWQHGVARTTEQAGNPVDTWNFNTAWIARTLTHLCASGFMFLLGMGIVYFGKSRAKLGWSAYQMVSHFAIRGFVLALVNEFLTIMIGGGRFILTNIVLLALAFDYFFAGVFWLALEASEKAFARLLNLLPAFQPAEDEASAQPLLERQAAQRQQGYSRAATVSWHVHNVILFAVSAVAIWWNIWLSPNHGRCEFHTDAAGPSAKSLGPWFDFWFYTVVTKRVMSVFPPLAWLSFALFGVLYGRIVLARPWASSTISIGNAIAGAAFALLFVATRLLHFGNLSEGCLRMPEQLAHPHGNQYLASFKSFFYVVKYPPDVAFLAFTMAFNFFLLAFFGALPPRVASRIPVLLTFGTSALFFYAVHLPLYGGLGLLVVKWFGHKLPYPDPFNDRKHAIGVNLLPFWITWAIGLAILLPLCAWFGRFKRSKGPNSIWRFF